MLIDWRARTPGRLAAVGVASTLVVWPVAPTAAEEARVTQAVVEYVRDPDPSDALLTQAVLEALHPVPIGALDCTQAVIEYIADIGTGGGPDNPPGTDPEPDPPPPGDTRQLRRLRRAPHLSQEEKAVFYSYFELDMEVGIGLAAKLATDPQVMLHWSDDGGHTWSNEHWRPAGASGDFVRRVVWNRLGTARDRIFEVIVSDPVRWRIVQAFLGVEVGKD